jgi:hypothetical protein
MLILHIVSRMKENDVKYRFTLTGFEKEFK